MAQDDIDGTSFGLGFLLAGVLAGLIGLVTFKGCEPTKAKIFREEGKPAVMRLYEPGLDQYFVESSKEKDTFVDMNMYNANIRQDYVNRTEKSE